MGFELKDLLIITEKHNEKESIKGQDVHFEKHQEAHDGEDGEKKHEGALRSGIDAP